MVAAVRKRGKSKGRRSPSPGKKRSVSASPARRSARIRAKKDAAEEASAPSKGWFTAVFYGVVLVLGYSATGFLGALSLDPATGLLPYDTQGLNMLTELGKLLLALWSIRRESPAGLAASLRLVNARSLAVMAVPAVLYYVNNNLGLLGFNYLSLTAGTVLSQLKIVVSGLLRRWLLGKRLTVTQWSALVACTCATIIAVLPPCGHLRGNDAIEGGVEGIEGGRDPRIKETTWEGVVLYTIVNVVSALAAVWTEFSYTESATGARASLAGQSFALRNAQLYFVGTAVGALAVATNTDAGLAGVFDGYGPVTYALLAAQVAIGLVVSLSLRHAGSMVKVLALPVFLITSIVFDALWVGTPDGQGITPQVFLGGVGVAIAILQYSLPPEVLESVKF